MKHFSESYRYPMRSHSSRHQASAERTERIFPTQIKTDNMRIESKHHDARRVTFRAIDVPDRMTNLPYPSYRMHDQLNAVPLNVLSNRFHGQTF